MKLKFQETKNWNISNPGNPKSRKLKFREIQNQGISKFRKLKIRETKKTGKMKNLESINLGNSKSRKIESRKSRLNMWLLIFLKCPPSSFLPHDSHVDVAASPTVKIGYFSIAAKLLSLSLLVLQTEPQKFTNLVNKYLIEPNSFSR